MDKRFLRTAALIGEDSLGKLKNSTVAVFGIGGVGSYALEALARSGVGTIIIYDNDCVSESNLNRQLIALDTTVGMLKTKVAARRCKDINPDIKIEENPIFVTPQSDIDFSRFDFIIDAIDNVTAKLYLIQGAKDHNVPIISVMGTGNKLNPEKLKTGDIFETRECPLCRVMRTELKKRDIKKLTVIWSDERPIKSAVADEPRSTERPSPSSMAFVPATAGLMAASYAVRKLISK